MAKFTDIKKTRKEHTCHYCGCTIEKGNEASRVDGKHAVYHYSDKGEIGEQVSIEYVRLYACIDCRYSNIDSSLWF